MLQGKSRSLDTKKLFTMSVILLCLTRTMGFVTIGALNMQSVDFDDHNVGLPLSRRSSSWRNDADERFYEKTMMVRACVPVCVAHGHSLVTVVVVVMLSCMYGLFCYGGCEFVSPDPPPGCALLPIFLPFLSRGVGLGAGAGAGVVVGVSCFVFPVMDAESCHRIHAPG